MLSISADCRSALKISTPVALTGLVFSTFGILDCLLWNVHLSCLCYCSKALASKKEGCSTVLLLALGRIQIEASMMLDVQSFQPELHLCLHGRRSVAGNMWFSSTGRCSSIQLLALTEDDLQGIRCGSSGFVISCAFTPTENMHCFKLDFENGNLLFPLKEGGSIGNQVPPFP